MAKIAYPNKNTGDTFSADEATEVKTSVNALYDLVDTEDTATLAAANAYTDTKVAQIVDSSPETLNTLNELAQALGDDPNFATSIATQIGLKENSANKSTDIEADKLSNIKFPSVKSVYDWATGLFATISNLALKANVEATATTGTAVTFTEDKVYGSKATPETGNITGNITGAKLGVTILILHNSGTTPTLDSKFKKLSGSGNYAMSQLNYIYCTYIDTDEIAYSIQQRS